MNLDLALYVELTPPMLAIIQRCATLAESIRMTMDNLAYYFPQCNFDKTEVQSRHKAFRKKAVPTKISQSTHLVTLLNQKALSLDTFEGWYYQARYDSEDHLVSLIWMSPDQRELFWRYGDVVVNDTTCQTNRLGMKLNCSVIVDSKFKTRLIACALTRQEIIVDYIWILAHLSLGGGGRVPKVLVDEDPAMDVACPETFKQTHVVNCVWHINKNIAIHLRRPLGNERFKTFMEFFSDAREALTPCAFEVIWGQLTAHCGGQAAQGNGAEKVRKYVARLYARRFHWAGPWVLASFTAGMRSTQRVEMTHHLIKMLNVNSNTSLVDLFSAISMKVQNEVFRLKSSAKDLAELPHSMAMKLFGSVLRLNQQYLDSYASSEMKLEMDFSCGLRHSPVDVADVMNNRGDVAAEPVSTIMRKSRMCFESVANRVYSSRLNTS